MKCNICGATPNQCKGWLERVNEKGVTGIFECRPMCGADLPPNDRIEGAIAISDADRDSYYKGGGLHPCYD